MNAPRSLGRVRMWVAGFALLLLPTQALAHTSLTHSSPASGAHLNVAPRELRLRFNEQIEIALARLSLVGPQPLSSWRPSRNRSRPACTR